LIKFHGNTVEFGSAANQEEWHGSTPAALVAKASTRTISHCLRHRGASWSQRGANGTGASELSRGVVPIGNQKER
jgi:hypothetical protein